MARFLGEVQGNRGQAHRLGYKSGGLTVRARSFIGDIAVALYVDKDDNDCARISISGHHGFGYTLLMEDTITNLRTIEPQGKLTPIWQSPEPSHHVTPEV